MEFPINYIPEGLAYGDKPRFITATDGDTPSIDIPVRLLGMDAPEIHFSGANENNPGKYDLDLANLLGGQGANLDAGLKAYIAPKLLGQPSTLHIQQGRSAFDHFEKIVAERLERISDSTGNVLTPRRLFTKASKEVFDHYGRLLAYIAPSYTAVERQSIPAKDRPTFNLQMMQDGHAASLLIYPNVPKPDDLSLVRSAIVRARQFKRGAWKNTRTPLHAYEYRWLVRVARGEAEGPTRFCGDIRTAKLYLPHDYYRVPDEDRLFFFDSDVGHAYAMGFSLQS